MNTVVLEVRSLEETLADAACAMKTGRAEREARISFASPELLWDVLTAKRWELLKVLCGAGPVSIREAARRVGRIVKTIVHRCRSGVAGLVILGHLGGCATGVPIHAGSELAKENPMSRIAIIGAGRVEWPRIGEKEPVLGLEASKQTLDATLPLVKTELLGKGYEVAAADPVGVFPNPTHKENWVFTAAGEFDSTSLDNAGPIGFGEDIESRVKPDKSSGFDSLYQLRDKAPAYVYPGYASDPALQNAARTVFDFLDNNVQAFSTQTSANAAANRSPPLDALTALGKRSGADTLCFAQVEGYRFTTTRKVVTAALNLVNLATMLAGGVVVYAIPPRDSAWLALTCYDLAKGRLVWRNGPHGLGDPGKPSADAVKNLLLYFPKRGQPLAATCKPDEKAASIYRCSEGS